MLFRSTDGLGSVTLNGAVLAGGAGSRGLYWNDDKSVYYTLTHASDGSEVLGVNGVLTIAGFQNGRLGVTLVGPEVPNRPRPSPRRRITTRTVPSALMNWPCSTPIRITSSCIRTDRLSTMC